MIKTAYHRLCLPNGEQIEGPVVVETDEQECFVGWHLLCNEEPNTLWRGGTYKIKEKKG